MLPERVIRDALHYVDLGRPGADIPGKRLARGIVDDAVLREQKARCRMAREGVAEERRILSEDGLVEEGRVVANVDDVAAIDARDRATELDAARDRARARVEPARHQGDRDPARAEAGDREAIVGVDAAVLPDERAVD